MDKPKNKIEVLLIGVMWGCLAILICIGMGDITISSATSHISVFTPSDGTYVAFQSVFSTIRLEEGGYIEVKPSGQLMPVLICWVGENKITEIKGNEPWWYTQEEGIVWLEVFPKFLSGRSSCR